MIRSWLLAAVLGLCTSAASAFTLVGKWNCDPLVEPDFRMTVSLDYRSNGNTRHFVEAEGKVPDGDLSLSLRVFGTWSLLGMELTEEVKRHRLQSVSLDGETLSGGPFWDQLAADLADSLSNVDEEEPATIRPLSDTAFEMNDGSVLLTCRRPGTRVTS